MSWTLVIADPSGTTVQTITDTDSPPITEGAPSCEVSGRGDCQSLTFRGLASSLSVEPRSIVSYEEDGNPLFWGPTLVLPSPESQGAGPADSDSDSLNRHSVAGGRQLVKDSLVLAYYLEGVTTDVAAIALEICSRYAHPALTVDAANFPDVGENLDTFYEPERKLSDALDDLAKTVAVGAIWYVDALGAIHFEAE